MALITEDGTGLSTAESFVSVIGASAYHTAFGNAAWAAIATDALREAYLRRASSYMEGVYRELWAGYRVNTTQALSWPRYEVPIKDSSAMNYGGYSYYPSDEVPTIVANACASLALRASTGELAPDVGRVTKSEQVGEIAIVYADGAAPFVRYREIDLMLSAFIKGSANSIRVVRA